MKKTFFATVAAMVLFSCAPVTEKKIETMFYPAPPQRPKIQFLFTITSEDDIGKKQSSFDEFLLGKQPTQKRIQRPYDISSAKGKIYVLDKTYGTIIIIDLETKKFNFIDDRSWGSLGDPAGIWVTEDEVKYVADIKRKQVVVFGKDNKFIRAYGRKDQFDKPVDVAVYKNRIYVCDHKKHMIIVLDKDTGKTIQTIGGIGAEKGKMYRPTHVKVDHEGNIFVNDNFNFRIQMFDPRGNFMKTFGHQGDTTGSFARPKGLDIDREKHLYVVDAAFENVQIFDVDTANLLLFFGGPCPKPGCMYLPLGLYIDYQNTEYFQKYADKDFRLKYVIYNGNLLGGTKLNVFGFGDWTGEVPEGTEGTNGGQRDEQKTAQ